MAGFHFNSGLFRLDSVYHRFLKIAVDEPTTGDTVKGLRPKVDGLYPQWTQRQWLRTNADGCTEK